MDPKNYVWSERYRPTLVEDCILPDELKQPFRDIVKSGVMQNMLLAGTSGTGKTTISLALANEMGYDAKIINASLDSGIDVLRSDITTFASRLSLEGKPKVVIFDEADFLSSQTVQPALRGFMQTFTNNCRFIFTCNYKSRIIEAIHSRCAVVEFKIQSKDKPALASQMFKRVCKILKDENVEYDKKVVVELITKHFPDFRRVIEELQRYSVSGTIDSGILLDVTRDAYKNLFAHMKEKNFTEVRKWVALNADASSTEVFRTLFELSSTYMEPKSIPQAILILADYSYKAAFVADQEINMVAAFVEIMASCNFV